MALDKFSDHKDDEGLDVPRFSRPWDGKDFLDALTTDLNNTMKPSDQKHASTDIAHDQREEVLRAWKAVDEAFTNQPEYADAKFTADPIDGEGVPHSDIAERVKLDTGQHAWIKPAYGETYSGREGLLPGDGVRRNVASYEIDRALSLDVTPRISLLKTQLGEASIQIEAPHGPRPCNQYSEVDQDRMAVLDYVTGQTDRHQTNWASTNDYRPAAIDNGLCLSRSLGDGIRSDFVAERHGKPLHADVIAGIAACDRAALDKSLARLGIEKEVRIGVLRRINEILEDGYISGRTWVGQIYDSDMHTVL